jgi:hypothetical protein
MCNRDVNDPLTCFNCAEFRNSLHRALTELSSLQVINKLLFKELEMNTAKLEVMSGVVSDTKVDESRNRWSASKRKECESEGYGSIGGNNKVKHIHTPYLHIPTNNRFDILPDRLLSDEDADFVMQSSNSMKSNPKSRRYAKRPQTRHYTKHRNGEPGKVTNYCGHEPVNLQEDLTRPKNIPTIIDGCVSPYEDEKVFFFL